jgi:hypothetical protein
MATEALLGLLSRPAWRETAARSGLDEAMGGAPIEQLLISGVR